MSQLSSNAGQTSSGNRDVLESQKSDKVRKRKRSRGKKKMSVESIESPAKSPSGNRPQRRRVINILLS